MDILDYIVLCLFTGIVVLAGVSFGRSGSSMKSYFAAGGAVPWGISSLSLFMSFFSAGTFVVWGSIAYQYGFVAISIQLTMCLAGLIVGLYIAPAWRRSNALTAAEFVTKRLGHRVQKFYSYLILFISLIYTGAFLYPVAIIVHVSTGISVEACIIALGALIIIYTVVGGLWAVMITDVLQFVVLTAAVLIVVPLAFDRVGGMESFMDKVPEGFFSMTSGEYSWIFLLAFGIYNGIFIGGNWAYVQRYTSVDTPESARKVGYLFAGLYLISPFIWMIPPMLYRVVDPGLSGLENEQAYLLMCKEVLPSGLIGLMLGGMVFATGSSVNTTLNLAAAVFTNDLYRAMKPAASSRQLMLIAKIATGVFGIGTIFVALCVPAAGGIVEIVLSVGAVTGCSLYGPPIWALFSKRHSGRSILYCTILGLSINLYFKLISPYLTGFTFNRSEEMLAGALIPLALLLGYELYAWADNQVAADYLRFKGYAKDHSEDDNKDENPENQNRFGIKVLGFALAAIAIVFLILGGISQMNLLVIGIGISILLFGLYLSRQSKQSISK